MTNRYLEKIARMHNARAFLKDLGENIKTMSPAEKVGFGMSTTGLGMGAANLTMSLGRDNRDKRKTEVEEQSLSTLKGIHKTLAKGITSA